jgi:hypothetical protein
MIRQLRFTTQDFDISDPSRDCVLDPQDPIYTQATGQPARNHLPQIPPDHRARQQRERNKQPGTPEWFELWFGQRK